MRTSIIFNLLFVFSVFMFISCEEEDAIISLISEVTIAEDSPIYAGDDVDVKWISDNVKTLKFELWNPSTSEWIILSNSVSGSDTVFSVEIPSNSLSGDLYKIKLTDMAGSVSAESTAFEVIGLQARTESISMGASYAKDIYFSLTKGVVAEVVRANWDIAFSVGSMSSSVLINEGAGIELKAHPSVTSWTSTQPTDTTGYSTWNKLYNSDISWEEGAFGQNATGHPNYGWGNYNMTTHNVEGVAMYIVKLQNGNLKKIFIEIKDAANKQYRFKYANIDGTGEVSQTISIDGKESNFIYFSIANNALITDVEPDASKWDLVFTKWIDNTINYPVTGVIQNIDIKAIDKSGVDVNTVSYTDVEFDSDINIIGSDWKTFSMSTYQYIIPTDRAFFVKNKDGKVFKIVFKSFAGSSTGNLSFDISPML